MLTVVDTFKADAVVEEGLRQVRVHRVETFPLGGIRAGDQIVPEVENRRVGDVRVLVLAEIGVRQIRVRRVARVAGNAAEAVELDAADVLVDRAVGLATELGVHFAGTGAAECGGAGVIGVVNTTHDLPAAIVAEPGIIGLACRKMLAGTRRVRGVDRPGIERIVSSLVQAAEPRGDIVAGRENARTVGLDVTGLVIDLERRVCGPLVEEGRLVAHGAEETLVTVEGRLLPILGIVAQTFEADGQLILDQHAVDVHQHTIAAVAADARFNLATIFEDGGLGRIVDDARRTAEAEQNAVRAALHVDAVDIVGIPRNVRQEIVAGIVRRSQTADAGVGLGRALIRLADRLAVAGAGEVTGKTADFRIGRINEKVSRIAGTRILQKLFGRHRNRRAHITQVGVESSAGQSAGGDIAHIAFGIHHEGAQHDNIILAGFGGGRGCIGQKVFGLRSLGMDPWRHCKEQCQRAGPTRD